MVSKKIVNLSLLSLLCAMLLHVDNGSAFNPKKEIEKMNKMRAEVAKKTKEFTAKAKEAAAVAKKKEAEEKKKLIESDKLLSAINKSDFVGVQNELEKLLDLKKIEATGFPKAEFIIARMPYINYLSSRSKKFPMDIKKIEEAIKYALEIKNLLSSSEKKDLFEKSKKIYDILNNGLRKAKLRHAVDAGNVGTVKKLLGEIKLNPEEKNAFLEDKKTLIYIAGKKAANYYKTVRSWRPLPTPRKGFHNISKADVERKVHQYKEIEKLLSN